MSDDEYCDCFACRLEAMNLTDEECVLLAVGAANCIALLAVHGYTVRLRRMLDRRRPTSWLLGWIYDAQLAKRVRQMKDALCCVVDGEEEFAGLAGSIGATEHVRLIEAWARDLRDEHIECDRAAIAALDEGELMLAQHAEIPRDT